MVGVFPAEPTPAKKRRGVVAGRKRGVKKAEDGGEDGVEEQDGALLAAVDLPAKTTFIPRDQCEELLVWDELAGTGTEAQVIATTEVLQPGSVLPMTSKRKPGRQGAATAAHAFNVPEVPGLYSGTLVGMFLLTEFRSLDLSLYVTPASCVFLIRLHGASPAGD
jgi:hypothetical protein